MAEVLIIDDDDLMCATLSNLVKRSGHEVEYVTSLHEGQRRAAGRLFDVVFLDVHLPDGNGLDLLPRLEALSSAPEVIIITGFGDPSGAELAIKSGAWDYIEKSSSAKEIRLALERALQYRTEKQAVRQKSKVAALKRPKIIGESAKPGDMDVNAVREKKLTNIRSAGAEDAMLLRPPRDLTLELALEYIEWDEYVEVTPKVIRPARGIKKKHYREKSRVCSSSKRWRLMLLPRSRRQQHLIGDQKAPYFSVPSPQASEKEQTHKSQSRPLSSIVPPDHQLSLCPGRRHPW